MVPHPEMPAQNPFVFRECFLMPMPLGQKVVNLRELLQALREVKESVLYYHLIQSRLVLTTPAVEFPNDFALWAAAALQDVKLAEKLSSFDPFDYESLEKVRQAMVDLLEEYLWDSPYVPWARPGFEFHFCEASTVVLRSEIAAQTLREFCESLNKVGLDSLYYHFFEARWRLEMGKVDDFSFWIDSNFELPELVAAIRDIDIYFYSLKEIRDTLLGLIHQHLGELCDRTE
ncbi:MAG: hypothetical protein A2Y80_02825 [Deltaproteobacteria bacterium RBG_13_58_19]|nr:MAG: hypothetical protein A2Y80_02825 [Deltaproteobacteria bacterium RBG_13_58_19]